MPITPRQARVLRDRLGDTTANEIVEVLNTVESTSLTELRVLNEANAARFESKMGLRFDLYETKMDRRFAEYDAKMADRLLVHTRWMLGAWTTVFLAIIGLWFRK
jgi:hypothetical protein